MTIIDDTNELTELIAEYTLKRVERMDAIYPNSKIRTIEYHLDMWKEESLADKEKGYNWANNLGYTKKLGNYFDN